MYINQVVGTMWDGYSGAYTVFVNSRRAAMAQIARERRAVGGDSFSVVVEEDDEFLTIHVTRRYEIQGWRGWDAYITTRPESHFVVDEDEDLIFIGDPIYVAGAEYFRGSYRPTGSTWVVTLQEYEKSSHLTPYMNSKILGKFYTHDAALEAAEASSEFDEDGWLQWSE